ncbi:MAG: SCO family protein [Myxococcales bacterium]|nr:SCO family protein [Myxococcales bacterium]
MPSAPSTSSLLRRGRALLAAFAFAFAMSAAGPARAQGFMEQGPTAPTPEGMPEELKHVAVKEHLDQGLPLDAKFRDLAGKPVELRQMFDGKRPVVLLFAYHSCPVLCSMILSATSRALQGVQWSVGAEFDMVVISIDPNDTAERAAAKRDSIVRDYGRGDGRGFHFLLGDKANIDRVAEATGFTYQYDERQKQYAHPSVMMLVKPNGQMARYLYGLEFDPNDVRLGLLEASEGRSISTVEQIILYCYHYDPQGGRYVLVATRVMQVGGALTALLLGGMLSLFWLRERNKGGLLAALEPTHTRPPREAAATPS